MENMENMEQRTEKVEVMLTTEEKRRLRVLASTQGLSMAAMLRRLIKLVDKSGNKSNAL